MAAEVPVLDVDEFLTLPIYGKQGRIAHLRGLLGLTQPAFAQLVREYGGTKRLTYETVLRWETLAPGTGQPVQKLSTVNANALVELAFREFGVRLQPDTFLDLEETPLDRLIRQQEEMRAMLVEMRDQVRRLAEGERAQRRKG